MEKAPDGKTKAVLSFFADLPSGGSFDFVLGNGNTESYPKMKIEQKGGEIVIQTDKLSVWLPASQDGEAGILQGPVLGIFIAN